MFGSFWNVSVALECFGSFWNASVASGLLWGPGIPPGLTAIHGVVPIGTYPPPHGRLSFVPSPQNLPPVFISRKKFDRFQFFFRKWSFWPVLGLGGVKTDSWRDFRSNGFGLVDFRCFSCSFEPKQNFLSQNKVLVCTGGTPGYPRYKREPCFDPKLHEKQRKSTRPKPFDRKSRQESVMTLRRPQNWTK